MRGRWRWATAGALVVLGAFAAAVFLLGSDGGGDGSVEDAWTRLEDRILDEGGVTEEIALDAFALAFGPLPGVDPPQGALARPISGTESLRWISRYEDDLTDEQRRAVARVVTGNRQAIEGGGDDGALPAHARPATILPDLSDERLAELERLAYRLRDDIGDRTGKNFTIPMAFESVDRFEGADGRPVTPCTPRRASSPGTVLTWAS